MKVKTILNILLVVVMLSACGSSKDIAYIENSQTADYSASQTLFDARIKPKDEVVVLINCPTSPEAAIVFNVREHEDNSKDPTDIRSGRMIKTYKVDNEGFIEFPLIGKVKIIGLNVEEAEALIKDEIKGYFRSTDMYDVYVTLLNYSISVVGEVHNPGVFNIPNQKVSVFEALARAGDMTIYGVRTDVKLIRELQDGRKEVHSLDMTDADIINSPYYYMQQRDILYVQPNEAKSKNSDIGNNAKYWIRGASIGISVASLVWRILR